MPFLGFPGSFKTYFYVSIGIILMALIELMSIQYCSRCDDPLDNHVEDDLDRYKEPKRSSKLKKDLYDQNEHAEEVDGLSDDQPEELK